MAAPVIRVSVPIASRIAETRSSDASVTVTSAASRSACPNVYDRVSPDRATIQVRPPGRGASRRRCVYAASTHAHGSVRAVSAKPIRSSTGTT